MKVTQIEKKNRNRYFIHTDHGDVLPMSGKDILLFDLRQGEEVTQETLQEIMECVRKDCLRKCGALLGSRDYSVRRLCQKLRESGYPESIAETAVEELGRAGYLDDRRMAENYVRIHTDNRSRRRILSDLERLGIDADLAHEVLDEARRQETDAPAEEGAAEDSEIRQIIALMEKKRFDPSTADRDARDKFMAFLYRKGYETDSIRAALGRRMS